MAELKTKKTNLNVDSFLDQISEDQKKRDAYSILKLMEDATKSKARMWGNAIIGFGEKKLKYPNGRELDWFIMGFSPRKQNFALYIHGAVTDNSALLIKLGKYKTGKGCLYINKLVDIDTKVLKEIIISGLHQ
jgi:hypothetical protein